MTPDVVHGGRQVEAWDIPAVARAALVRDGLPAVVGSFREAIQPGTDPVLGSESGPLYEIGRLVIPPEPELIHAAFGAEPGTGRVLRIAFGETTFVNSSIRSFLAFLAMRAEVLTRLYGAPDLDWETGVVVPPREVMRSLFASSLQRLLTIDRAALIDDNSYWHAEYLDFWEECGFPPIVGESPFPE